MNSQRFCQDGAILCKLKFSQGINFTYVLANELLKNDFLVIFLVAKISIYTVFISLLTIAFC